MRALFTGSFDPVTLGHLDLIRRMAELAESVVVAVAVNAGKLPMFSSDERVAMLREACRDVPAVEVVQFHGLAVDAVRQFSADVLMRGVRDGSDLAYEIQMARTNRALAGVETFLLPSSPALSFVSSSLVREIARFGGDVSQFVPAVVVEQVRARLAS